MLVNVKQSTVGIAYLVFVSRLPGDNSGSCGRPEFEGFPNKSRTVFSRTNVNVVIFYRSTNS